MRKQRTTLIIFLLIYILTVLWYTVFKRDLAIHNAQFELFWSYRKWFAGDADLGQEILANIVMFIPFGFLLASILPQSLWGRSVVTVIGGAILFSLTIETLQFVLMRGLFEWDDVFSNVVGATLGCLLFSLISRWKNVQGAVAIVFVLTCLAVAISGRNVGSVEADNTSRAYCFQVDEAVLEDGKIELNGFVFRYELETQTPAIILRSTDTGKRIKLETEQTQRLDVNNYFLCEHDYINSGFTARGSVEPFDEYEIFVRWPWSVVLSTGVYIDSSGVHYSPSADFSMPEIENAPDLKSIVEKGILRVYRPDYHCWVYQLDNSLYWIMDQDFDFEEDGTTYIQYQLYTTQENKLPAKRIENGWLWDNIGGFFEDYEIDRDFGEYRVMRRELPKEYAITSVVTGYYKNGEWIWKNYFRPIYDFERSGEMSRREMDITGFQVMVIRTSHSEHMLAGSVPVVDEGPFYRIAGTYILDKFKIKAVDHAGDKVTVHMKDGDVILTVVEE